MSFGSPSQGMSPARLRSHGISYWQQAIAGGLFTGLSPIASGTVASFVACLFYYIPGFSHPLVLLCASLIAFVAGFPLVKPIEEKLGSDPSFITIDEFAGQWLVLASPLIVHPVWPLFAFLCFRVFDIAKTWPASWFDRRGGAVGVMVDDIVAALYASICAHLIWYGLALIGIVREFMSS